MTYSIKPKLAQNYPDFARAVIHATNVVNSASNKELDFLFREEIARIESDQSINLDHPRISAWVKIYDTFKRPDSKKTLPSVGALIRRIKSGGAAKIPFVSSLVCISNLVALKFLCPSGLIDADKIVGDLALGYAVGGESFFGIGTDLVELVSEDEIIYYDTLAKVVLCRSWNSRGGKNTFITPETTNIVFDIDALTHVLSRKELESAANFADGLLKSYCLAKTHIFYMDSTTCEIKLS